MDKLLSIAFYSLIAFFAFNFFIRNNAEADAKLSYESYLAGKAIFIDVREESEVNEGMIKGALWFPLSKIDLNRKSEFEKIKLAAKDKEIYLYCRSGNRSGKVKNYLEEAGIKSVNVGGFKDMVKQNLPTQMGPN